MHTPTGTQYATASTRNGQFNLGGACGRSLRCGGQLYRLQYGKDRGNLSDHRRGGYVGLRVARRLAVDRRSGGRRQGQSGLQCQPHGRAGGRDARNDGETAYDEPFAR
ncbi:hypothetical protein [Alistipes communis]|uniref:hypothetical protein n=1 Tax=Alistipes communis TaxID=2585118 RepID=UPI003A89FF3C